MSHINFDFLTESILFGSGLEDKFSALSDYEIEKELNRYREYVISNMGEICREIISDSRKIAVTIESFSERPREELLKQLALYVDVVTISDPLFELTEKKSNSTKVMAEYYGMNWVVKKANILNVACTRAKYRIAFIGNINDWKNRRYFREFIPSFIDIINV